MVFFLAHETLYWSMVIFKIGKSLKVLHTLFFITDILTLIISADKPSHGNVCVKKEK